MRLITLYITNKQYLQSISALQPKGLEDETTTDGPSGPSMASI